MKVDIYNTNKKYNIIYADPPWSFKTYSKKGQNKATGAVTAQYNKPRRIKKVRTNY